jgi:hypothetical protein
MVLDGAVDRLAGRPRPSRITRCLPDWVLIDLAGMRMASIAAGVSLAHVGDRSFGVRCLDLERRDKRVLGLNRHLIRPVADLDPDRIP